jgi:small subunit ribosomal protein S11
MATASKSGARSKKKAPVTGIAYVDSTFNNTIITVTTVSGDAVASCSGGRTQKGARKATAHAAEEAGKFVGARVVEMGMAEVHVRIKGPGSGRDAAVRGLAAAGLRVMTVTECTPIPHNGCRRRKKKRN